MYLRYAVIPVCPVPVRLAAVVFVFDKITLYFDLITGSFGTFWSLELE
jgi:hypothetical protein